MGTSSRFAGGAVPGISRALQAFAGGQSAYDDAFGQTQQAGSKLLQALAAAQASEAAASKSDAEAALKRRELDLQGDPAIRTRAMLASGVPLDAGPDVESFLQSGRIDRFDPSAGPAMPAPEWAAPQNLSRLGQRLAAELSVIGGGSKGADDYFKGQQQQFETGLGRAVAENSLPPDAQARAMALLKASPLFKVAEGYTGNQYTGSVDMKAPENVGRSGYVTAQTGAQKANAAQSYAAADNSRASAERTRAEMAEGTNRSGAKAPTGYRWGNDGRTLEPIPGGPADPATKGAKLAKPPTEGQAKALMFGTRMAVSDEILRDLEGQYSRSGVNAARVATNLPLGSMVAGPMVSSRLSPASKQASQAQRDFINAVLRRESGAVITNEEFANAVQQYFPQPNDGPDEVAQKADNRRVAIEGMKAEFGEQSLPEFERIVSQARTSRKDRANKSTESKPAGQAASQPAQRNIVVNY